MPKYVLSYLDPGALAVDAFLQYWSKRTCLIHPPGVLLPRILKKIREDEATALLIAPNWSGQPWLPEHLFPSLSANCAPPSVAVAASSSLALIRNRYETTGFQRKLLTSCWHQEQPPRRGMQGCGRCGFTGVLNGASVPFQLL